MSGNLRPSKSPEQNNHHVCSRKAKMLGSRRSSVDTCFTEASSKHMSAKKDVKARHSMPVPPSTPLASHLASKGAKWEYLAQESPPLPTASTNQSTDFSFVSLDPPITQRVLSELDLPRLEQDLVLRHHLNFVTETELRLDTQGSQAEERRELDIEYWHALTTEITFWLMHCQRIAVCPPNRSLSISLPGPGATTSHHVRAPRLFRLFGAVRDIMKDLLPFEEWHVIDARLDVKFLMLQLERGICDFTALSEWLGNFLRPFCSPTRDRLLHTMTSAIRSGVENADVHCIVNGLINVFEILQGMKLDSANLSIKTLRLAWVENTIAFKQNDFLRRIASGWDVIGAQMWFQNLQEEDEESGSGLSILVKALTDAVIFYHQSFPPTFTLDYNRLRKLQVDFQALVYQAACRQTLIKTLGSLGWTGKILQSSYADLFFRVAVLISDQGLQYDYPEARGPVALEIVRAAYAICSNPELPSFKDLEFAENHLRLCCDPRMSVFEDLRSSLATELKDKIDDEVCALGDLTPLHLMRRLVPQQQGSVVQSEEEGLIHIAKRISHIAELHWRVWGPILYEQPVHVGRRTSGYVSSIEEGLHGKGRSRSRRTMELGR